MKKHFIWAFCLFSTLCFAQKGHIKGQVFDTKTKQSLPNASVAIFKDKDSTVFMAEITTKEGLFQLKNLDYGLYKLQISYVGYGQFMKQIDLKTPQLTLDSLFLAEGILLDDVKIVREKIAIVIKKDTIEFNADSFKTKADAVVEDLLKKLPGIQVDKQGNITAHGQPVSQILVDGKPFFGGNTKIATQNLPKEIVDKVQLIDQKSDEAVATGIDDGQRSKVINLTVKKDKKYGTFGNVSAGGGSQQRYMAGGMLNKFRDKKQISILANTNNLNTTGFNSDDFDSFAGGSSSRLLGGNSTSIWTDSRNNVQYFGGNYGGFGSIGGGISKGSNMGINFTDNLNKKTDISANYFYANNRNITEQELNRESFLPDATVNYYQKQSGSTTNQSHRFNLNIGHKIDSTSDIYVASTFAMTMADVFNVGVFSTQNKSNNTLINEGTQQFDTESTAQNGYFNVWYNKRLKKKGRSLSVTTSGTLQKSLSESINKTLGVGLQNSVGNINQKMSQDGYNNTVSLSMSYREPLTKKTSLSIAASKSLSRSDENRESFDFSIADNNYSAFNKLYSNHFENRTTNDRINTSLSTSYKKMTLRAGIAIVKNDLKNNDLTRDSSSIYTTYNLMPNASLDLNFDKKGSIRFYYSAFQQNPRLQDLQPVQDLSNPLYVRIGNPNLKPSVSNSFNLSSSFYDVASDVSFTLNSRLNSTHNQIIQNRIFDLNTGKQSSRSENINGNYSGNIYTGISKKIKSLKSSIRVGNYVNFGQQKNFINGVLNKSFSSYFANSLSINYDGDEIEGGLLINRSTQKTIYDIQKNLDNKYVSLTIRTHWQLTLPKDIELGFDAQHNQYQGLGANFDRKMLLANASLSKKVFAKKTGKIELEVNDLFNQNNSIGRNITDNGIEDSNSLVLRRYVLLKFVYRVSKFGKKP